MKDDLKIIPTAGVVVFDDQMRVLVVEHLEGAGHKTGAFGLPSGRTKENEEITGTAVRELFEETGIRANPQDLHFVRQYQATIERKDGTKTFSVDVYVCTQYSGALVASEETLPRWITMTELDMLDNVLPNVKTAIREAEQVLRSIVTE